MFRTSIKCPLGHLARVSSPRRPAIRHDFRLCQSTYSGSGGGGRGKVWLVVGALTAATAGTAVYAKYDPSFRKLLEENIPYSSSVLDVTSDLVDQVNGLIGGGQEQPVVQPKKDKVIQPIAPVITKTPPPSPAKPIETVDKNAQKKERELQAKASKNLIEFKSSVDAATLAAVIAYNEASQQMKALGNDMSSYSNVDPDTKLLATLIAKNAKTESLKVNASIAAAKARSQLDATKVVLESTVLLSSSEEVKETQRSLAKAEADLQQAENSLQQAQTALKTSQALQEQIQQARTKLEKELGAGWDSGRKEEQDLFLLLVSLRLMDYKDQLVKKTEAHQRALKESLAAAGEEGLEERVQLHLEAKEQELKQQLNKDYQTQLILVREDSERRAQTQLQQQAAILTEEKTSSLLNQRAAFARELSERMGNQLLQHTQQVGTAVEALKGADKNLRQLLGKIEHGAELLSMSRSCDALVRSLDINPFPALDWTHQRRAIDGHVRDVKQAFKDKSGDEFFSATLGMLPQNVINRGVFTEPALKARFYNVEKIARKVSMIRERENVSLSAYIISYLRSSFLVHPVSPIRAQEISNDPSDWSQLDNNAVLDRAKYFMDQGDLLQAVRFMNLLEGPAQFVASGWLEEARNLLEVQQVARTLAAYASLLVQQTAISSKTKQ